MWLQPLNPLHNQLASTLLAASPIVILGSLLLSRKMAGYIACIITLAAALGIAIFGYGMPASLALLSAAFGAANGLLPIGWIVVAAVFLYNLSVTSGSFAIVRRSIESITADRRLQALLIAFCFGAFLEGAAGFGAPVAITAGMLVGLGFEPLYAASICLLANTAPVAFGGLGIAVVTAGQLTNIDPAVLSRMIGHQLPFISLIIPLWLVVIMAGWRGARAIWPALIVTGGSYAITMFLSASYLGPAIPDILSSVVSLICLTTLLRFWQPAETWRFPQERGTKSTLPTDSISWHKLLKAWTPFVLLIVFIVNWANGGVQQLLARSSIAVPFGALANSIVASGHQVHVTYVFGWLTATGTGIILAALLSAILLQVPARVVGRVAKETILELKWPLVTIATIVGFAYVANFSGISATLSHALATTGHWFPLIAPLLGWLGVFLTGSDTSSNALFSGVQAHTAQSLGINPVLTVGANTSGGVAAKMISPQSIAVAAAATKLTNQEGNLFRRTVLHSLGIVTLVSLITYVQAYYLPWMIPALKALPALSVSHSVSATTLWQLGISLSAVLVISWLARRQPQLSSPVSK